jgi:hypothetical protein
MIELKIWKNEIAKNFKNLRANKMYNIFNVIRSVHVIFNETEHYYVNNYVKLNTYDIVERKPQELLRIEKFDMNEEMLLFFSSCNSIDS